MIIEVIPPKNWSSFLEYFSQLHRELICSIEILDGPSELNAGEHLKFSSISLMDGPSTELSIIADADGKEINHQVRNIKQICITRTREGNNSSIMIESAEDFVTSLNFTENENI
jgi:uncharacterized membrane protein